MERLQVDSIGKPTRDMLVVRAEQESWRLAGPVGPLASTSLTDVEHALVALRATDALFRLGQSWTFASLRPHHSVIEEPATPLNVQVDSVAYIGDTQYAFHRFSAGPSGQVWARRGSKLWFEDWVPTAPDFDFTKPTESDLNWLVDGAATIDVAAGSSGVACTATVCLPAWVAKPDKNSELALLPGIGLLRFVRRSYDRDTDDGQTAHQLLRTVAPVIPGQAQPGLAEPKPEPEALRQARERVSTALETGELRGLQGLVSRRFDVSSMDDPQAPWTRLDEGWTEMHRACMQRTLRALTSRPCVQLTATLASCTEPALTPSSWSVKAALAATASATFENEAGQWRLVRYLDALSFIDDASMGDVEMPACSIP